MGNHPSSPSSEQLAELEARKPELIARAARAIQQADILLVATGAGWSADSGLAIYRDVADVAAYHERDLTYRDICQPHFLDSEPALFYGFWGGCYNDYRNTAPHEGYGIIKQWVERQFKDTQAAAAFRAVQAPAAASGTSTAASAAAGAFFSYTSNVDAHWLTSGFHPSEVHAIHGDCETWQCANRDCADERARERAHESEDASVADDDGFSGRWPAPPSHRFQVDEISRLAGEGAPLTPASAPVGTGQPCDAQAFASNWPKCVSCGGPARPAVRTRPVESHHLALSHAHTRAHT